MSLKPFVYWAQSENDIFLKVDLKGTALPDICIEEEEIEFTATGIGAQVINTFNLQYRIGKLTEHCDALNISGWRYTAKISFCDRILLAGQQIRVQIRGHGEAGGHHSEEEGGRLVASPALRAAKALLAEDRF